MNFFPVFAINQSLVESKGQTLFVMDIECPRYSFTTGIGDKWKEPLMKFNTSEMNLVNSCLKLKSSTKFMEIISKMKKFESMVRVPKREMNLAKCSNSLFL